MKILVTGGAGYIGSHTCKALARAGHTPVVFDNLSTGHRWAVQWGDLVEADLADASAVERALRQYQIEAVVHFAANAYVGESMTEPRKYFRNNVVNSLNLLDAMLATKVRTIVFSSSCATYGIPEKMPIAEDTPQIPVNPYGESKLFIEKTLKWYGQAYGLKWMALRYFNAAGADSELDTGEVHAPETHLIPLVLQAATASGHQPLHIHGTDYPTADGTCIRDYIHVTDLADAHLKALLYLQTGPSMPINLGTGRGQSVRDVIATAQQITGRDIPTIAGPRRAGDPAELVAKADLAGKVLKWTPRHSDLKTILSTAWNWHLKNS